MSQSEERRRKLRGLLPDNMQSLPWVEYRFRPAQTQAEAASDIAFIKTYRELFDRLQNAPQAPLEAGTQRSGGQATTRASRVTKSKRPRA